MRPGPVAPVDRDVLVGAVVGVLVLAGALTWPAGSRFVEDAANELRSTIRGAQYVGYYADLDARDDRGARRFRLMFAPGRLPGIPTAPNVSVPLGVSMGPGGWAADGEHLVVFSAERMYLADRGGRLREIADLGPDLHFLWADWLTPRNDEIVALVGSAQGSRDPRRWLTRVRIGAGAETPRALPRPLSSVRGLSPSGRWLFMTRPAAAPGGCPERALLYDVEMDRLIEHADGLGRSLMVIGWMRDGRLMAAACGSSEGTIELFLAEPGTVPAVPLATLPWTDASPVPVIDPTRDRVLAAPGGGAAPATLVAIDAGGRRTDLGRIPAFTTSADETPLLETLSRDGRFLSFGSMHTAPAPASAGGPTVTRRTGVIELATGQVTEACTSRGALMGCTKLVLR